MVALKLKKKLPTHGKALFAPSTPILASAKSKVKKAKAIKAPEPSAKDKEVMRKIAENSKKKKGALSKRTKPDPERDAALSRKFEEYMKKLHAPAWGSTSLEADANGHDGYSTLKLETFVCKELSVTQSKLLKLIEQQDIKTLALIIKCVAYNAWVWSNFANRLWVNTLKEEPPIRKVVGIYLSDLIPCVNHQHKTHILDRLIDHMRKDKDVISAFATLGLCKTKVRLLPLLEQPTKIATMYKLYDLLTWQKGNAYSMRGLVIDANVQTIQSIPRDICIVHLDDQRKSALRQLEQAHGTGHKVIIPWSVLKGDFKTIKEMRLSETYVKLLATWQGLTPLISMPINSKMEIISKASKLGDVLLA